MGQIIQANGRLHDGPLNNDHLIVLDMLQPPSIMLVRGETSDRQPSTFCVMDGKVSL